MRRFSVTLILVMVLVGLQGAAFAAKAKKKVSHATPAQTSHRTTTGHHKATRAAASKPAAPDQDKKPK